MTEKTVRCFVDAIDWQHHIEMDSAGTKIYPDPNDVKRDNECVREGGCGIVEVEVRFVRWVEAQDLKYFPIEKGEK